MISESYDELVGNFEYNEVQLQYIVGAIKNHEVLPRIMQEIMTISMKQMQTSEQKKIAGCTKEELRRAIPKSDGKLMSIKVIDKYIGFLCGAMLICYKDKGTKEKRYVYNKRGFQVFRELQQLGVCSMEQNNN